MDPETSSLPLLVVGGGIGGLSAAVALARTGETIHVLEQAHSLPPSGAGIQLGPNATRILFGWGLEDEIAKVSSAPLKLSMFDGWSGNELNTVPLGTTAQKRYGAPYLTIHRADLQDALYNKALNCPNVTITFGFKASNFSFEKSEIRVRSDNGEEVVGKALIGADGIWSSVRESVIQPRRAELLFSGKTAWRTLLPAEEIGKFVSVSDIGLWMAPDGHLVHYPVKESTMVNVVAIIADTNEEAGWSRDGKTGELLAAFANWAVNARRLLERATHWQKWSLFELAKSVLWSKGPVTLLGDSAHPILPFLAQGGAMAIEDAELLAELLRHRDLPPETLFEEFAGLRRTRIGRVRNASRWMGWTYHLSGPLRIARNTVIEFQQPEKLLRNFDWLYGFDSKSAGDFNR